MGMGSDLVLLQPEGQAWWKGGQVPTRIVEGGGHRFCQIHISRLLQGVDKLYGDYKRQKRNQAYLSELSRSMGIPIGLLVQEVTDGPNELRGTWVHARIALHAAAWALVPLEVWLYGKLDAMFKGQEMVEAPSHPSAVVMLRAMADAIEQQDRKLEIHGQQLDFLTAEVSDVKREVKKTDLDRVCERRGIAHPSDWLFVTEAIRGPLIYMIRDPHDHTVFYVGESGVAESRLDRDRGKHEAYRYFGMKGLRYETVYIPAPSDTQDRINLERELTAAAKPAWQYQIQQEEKHWSRQFKTHKHPLHNYTASLLPA